MRPVGVNMTNVKRTNRSNVLRLLIAKGAMSRTELASSLNLTTATLTSICSEFIQHGLLVELGSSSEKIPSIGRKKCPLAINPSYKYVIAVSIHYSGSIVAITDLLGREIASVTLNSKNVLDETAFLHQVADACIRLLWNSKIPREEVLGVGVGIVGSVDNLRGISLNPFQMFHQSRVAIKDLLEAELPFRVCVENNVCAFLSAENLFNSIEESNTMVVKWGPGVGSASSINGIICKNRQYHSMEIGHTIAFPDMREPCRCGRYGCLETGINLHVFQNKINDLISASHALEAVRCKFGEPSIQNLDAYLLADCRELRDFAIDCARILSINVSNAVQIFSPDKIILYGKLFEIPYILDAFTSSLGELDPSLNMDAIHHRSDYKETLGPAAIAIEAFLLGNSSES